MAMLVPRVELSREQARLINLGGVAGTFMATGIVGLLALGGSFETAAVPMGIITAGGIAGLWSGFAIRRHELPSGAFSRGQRSMAGGTGRTGPWLGKAHRWQWNGAGGYMPLGYAAPADGRLIRGTPCRIPPVLPIRALLLTVRF